MIALILSLCLEYLVIRNWQQMVSGDLQSKQIPFLAHGVFRPNLAAFAGAATFLARFMAESRSDVTLFIPIMRST